MLHLFVAEACCTQLTSIHPGRGAADEPPLHSDGCGRTFPLPHSCPCLGNLVWFRAQLESWVRLTTVIEALHIRYTAMFVCSWSSKMLPWLNIRGGLRQDIADYFCSHRHVATRLCSLRMTASQQVKRVHSGSVGKNRRWSLSDGCWSFCFCCLSFCITVRSF